MRRQLSYSCFGRALPHHTPDYLFGDSNTPDFSALIHAAKDSTARNTGRLHPYIHGSLDPIRNGNGPDMPSLSYEVDNGPVILPFLQTLNRKTRQFRAAKSTTETNREDGSAALAPHRLDVCGVQQCSCFIGAEPIAKSYPEFLCSLYAADAGCQFRTKQAGISGLIGACQ